MSLDGSIGSAGLVEEFEFELLESVGRKKADGHFAIATGDISIAYQLAFSMLAIQAGDEIIMPAFQRNRAAIEAVQAVGAIPVLVDIDEATIGINPAEAEAAITERTRCIIAIDHEMTVCDHEALQRLAAKSKIEVIHDISTSYGTAYKGKPVGNQHNLTIMSCTPFDSLNCVEGAALLGRGTERLRLVENARQITLALPKPNQEDEAKQIHIDAESVGMSYKMTAFHAGIGISQIERVNSRSATQNSTIESLLEKIDTISAGIHPIRKMGYIPNLLCFRLKQGTAARKDLEGRGLVHQRAWAPLEIGEDNYAVSQKMADMLIYSPCNSDHIKNLFEAICVPGDD